MPMGVVTTAGNVPVLAYVEPDHLGTPRAVIDVARNVAVCSWLLTSEAFGNMQPDQDGDGVLFAFDLRFPGQRYDSATGFNQNWNRDYDPTSSRYVQSDPIGLVGGISTYSYALNSPALYPDSTGLAVWQGTSFSAGIGFPKNSSGFVDFYQLTSKCPNGGYAYAYVMATGAGAGLGLPVSMVGGYSETSTDSNAVPDPNTFNGRYVKISYPSFAFGLGGSLGGRVWMGGAWSNLFSSNANSKSVSGPQKIGGFDSTIISGSIGRAFVIEKRECSSCGGGK